MIAFLKSSIKKNYPGIWSRARVSRKLLSLIVRVYGYERRHCPICGNDGKFLAEIHFPDIFVFDAICPGCQSNSRNRLLKIAIDEKALIPTQARILHFAPEDCVSDFVRPMAAHYKTADISGKGVDLTLNIEKIDQPDGSWDVVICSHVLEHVDHVLALNELHRILAPGGKLLALFPIVDAWPTHYESSIIISEHDRSLHFGKENHLRRFGSSIKTEILNANFDLECFAPIGSSIVRLGLIPGETLFIATRN